MKAKNAHHSVNYQHIIALTALLLTCRSLPAQGIEQAMQTMVNIIVICFLVFAVSLGFGLAYAIQRRKWQRIVVFVLAGVLFVVSILVPSIEDSPLEYIPMLMLFTGITLGLLGWRLKPRDTQEAP